MFLHPRSFPDEDPAESGRGGDGRDRNSSGSSSDSILERNEVSSVRPEARGKCDLENRNGSLNIMP